MLIIKIKYFPPLINSALSKCSKYIFMKISEEYKGPFNIMYDAHMSIPKLSLDRNKSEVAVGMDHCADDVT